MMNTAGTICKKKKKITVRGSRILFYSTDVPICGKICLIILIMETCWLLESIL
jgi:hypothetical protein